MRMVSRLRWWRAFAPLAVVVVTASACVNTPVREPSALDELEAGIALYEQGQYGAAIEYFERALSLDPKLVEAHLYLGRSLLESGHWLEGLAHVRDAMSLASPGERAAMATEFVDSLIQAALGLLRQGEFQESIGALREAVALSPESEHARDELSGALVAFGKDLFSRGRFREAISAFSESIGIVPDRLDAYIGLAKSFFQNGELSDAIGAAKRALELAPSSGEAKTLLRSLLQGG